MIRNRTRLLPAVVLAAATILAGIHPATALKLPREWTFRSSIAHAEYIVVGAVRSIEPFSERVQARRGTIAVARCLWGGLAAGDSILVNWNADRWSPTDSTTSIVACGGDVQLDEYIDVPALWMIRISRGGVRVHDPIVLADGSREHMARMVQVMDDPPEHDILAGELARKDLSGTPAADIELKLGVVREFLQDQLGQTAGSAGQNR